MKPNQAPISKPEEARKVKTQRPEAPTLIPGKSGRWHLFGPDLEDINELDDPC